VLAGLVGQSTDLINPRHVANHQSAGDHTDRAMRGSGLIGDALSQWLRTSNVTIGEPRRADPSWWDVELERAAVVGTDGSADRQVMAQG
jgi:hypothetical protein